MFTLKIVISRKKLMISVRLAHTEDIEKISYVLAASWKTAYRGIVDDDYLDSLSNDHWVDFLATALNGDSVFAMVLQEKQEIVGASILGKSEQENETHMISLYLLPEKIGKGLGHIFYSEIEKEIQNKGFTKCTIDVLKDNERAIKFYKMHGFVDMFVEAKTTLGSQDYPYMVFEKVL
ncbi:MAG: GNAT family N-acetyltransferase [Synergistaceae bacterium]|nr:GNAT family N-acetyltransferase [Synergistaceae bacterium]